MSLEAYLHSARRRLRWRERAWAGAVVAGVVSLVTLTGGALVMTLVPSSGALGWVRGLLSAALLAVVTWLAWRRWPLPRVAVYLEAAVPAFGGRLSTWLDTAGRGDPGPLLALLERQTRAAAADHPVTGAVRLWPACLALAAGVGMIAALGVWLAGTDPWPLAARRLWSGELFAAAAPRIVVSPGDTVVRRGSDVVISARAQGFVAPGMDIAAAFGRERWEHADMMQAGDGAYGFVFVAVDEEIEYYVSTRGLNSERHRIRVADLPRVTAVRTRYAPPEWSGLAPADTARGDVRALPGTTVQVNVSTDRPAPELLLVVNGVAQPMTGTGGRPGAEFVVSAPGEWHVAMPYQGTLARISATFLIEVREDRAPTIDFRWPGHDRRASAIEEVDLEFDASDDYAVETLTLNYAVNAGSWTSVTLDPAEGAHTLRLEELSATTADAARVLAPGDVISMYAEARDHSQSGRSALYFLDVRPFEMRYHESQRMGGSGATQGGAFDIAQRQRDIVSATWNLQNERDPERIRQLEDETRMLTLLQQTLREQVETVVARSSARGLGRSDEVGGFVEHLSLALEPMRAAAARLGGGDLEAALPAEQAALAHLVAAESSVRDVEVALARGDARGTSGRDLEELVELEMDPQRNRYEMPRQAGLEDAAGAAPGPAWERLEALAARQERLARQRERAPESLPTRWEQARLRREIEQLRKSLEGNGTDAPTDRAVAELSRAERALSDQRGGDGKAARHAAEALERGAELLRSVSQGDQAARLERAGRRTANLRHDQQRVVEALDELQATAVERMRRGEGGLSHSDYGMHSFSEVKRRMQDDLGDLRAELAELGRVLGATAPEAAQQLDEALAELDDARVDERLGTAAEAFELGQPLYVVGSEALVERAFDRLAQRLADAGDALNAAQANGAGDPLAEVRTLRRRLQGARAADGTLRADEVEAVARAADSLDRAGRGADPRPLSGATGRYGIRGTADENTEVLFRMTLDRLDLVEAGLETADSPPIRAQDPRAAERDSAQAARYFRDLSRGRP